MFSFTKNSFIILLVLGTSLITFGHGNPVQTTGLASAAKEIISMPGAKTTGLPFSSAVKVGNVMFVSGVIGTDVKTNQLVSDDVVDQTRLCLEKLKSVINQGGMSLADVVNCTVYLTDINDYDAMNKVYATFFPSDPPARACVQVAKLVRGAKVEISFIAANSKQKPEV
ncbi:MAG: Rid family detoxifying hydrolase [Candidatus Aminicenantes bacterium]|nr:Rid family detoxifying hydrolase [Candidatus Aminicenantes bacterium]